MFHNVSKKIIQYATNCDIVTDEKQEEYIYGLELTLSVLLSNITVFMIGILMKMPIEAITFIFIYQTLRRYAGGFHFESQVLCYLSTYIMCPVAFFAIKYLECSNLVYFIIMIASSVLLFIVSPIPAVNKPLDDKEKKIYGKIARILILSAVIAYIICFSYFQYASKIIAVSVGMVAVFAILSKIRQAVCKN